MKITFITEHNWETKRQGGFHVFARKSAQKGIETVFFTFPRPYYGVFLHRENVNREVMKTLRKGKLYIEDDGAKILNVTYPTFKLPFFLGKILPDFLMNFLETFSLQPFKFFSKKFLSGTDCFVFESNECIFLLAKIKKLFPNAKIIYRPSDPLVYNSVPMRVKKAEQEILYKADMSLIVSEKGVLGYRESIPEFDTKVKYRILTNGLDIEACQKKYEVPELLKKPNTVLYIGACPVEWEMLFLAAQKLPDANFIVVCPNYPESKILKRIEKTNNLFYVPGIMQKEVPAWLTNCNVVMVPYEKDFYKDRYLSITAKFYQAMAAEKPLVVYSADPKLKEFGIVVTYAYDDFINEVKTAMEKKNVKYNLDLQNRDWNKICKDFLQECGYIDLNENPK